jgi:REP element-mobilizing transposase RayT
VARPPRPQFPGGIYHLTTRRVVGPPLFRDDGARDTFLNILGHVVRWRGWRCYAYVVMTTHYHVLVETPEADLGQGMQRLNSFYAGEFNRRQGTTGHVFERRYTDVVVESDAHFATEVAYIAANPVRAGMCKRPEDYRYSSYATLVGDAPPVSFLDRSILDRFHRNPERATELMKEFVDAYIARQIEPPARP